MSLEHLNGALTLAIQLNNDEARANILQAIGIAYMRLDRPEEALRHYEESLEIKQRLSNKRGMATSLGEIGADPGAPRQDRARPSELPRSAETAARDRRQGRPEHHPHQSRRRS